MTAALEWVEWPAARPGHTLPPGKTRYPFYRRVGGLQGRSERAENLVPTGIRSRTIQHVVGHYTDWATLLTIKEYMYSINPLMPNDPFSGRTAPLTSKSSILCIYSSNTSAKYFKHGIYSAYFSLQNAVCFIILTYLCPVLFTFYIQGVLKLKKNNSSAKRINNVGLVEILKILLLLTLNSFFKFQDSDVLHTFQSV